MRLQKLKLIAIKRATTKRNGIFEAVAMIGVALIMLVAIVTISQMLVALGPDMAVDLLTDMPTFFEWQDGSPVTETVSDGLLTYEVPKTTKFIQVYEVIVWLAVAVGVISGLIALASWILEDFDIVPKGEAVKKFFHLMFLIPIVVAFPFIWDLIAVLVENTSIFLMNPFDPSDPTYYAERIFNKAGSIIQEDDILSVENWGVAFSNPRYFVEGIVSNVLLAAFKGFIVIQLVIYMLFFSAIREFMNFVLVMLFPFIWILKTIEFTKSIGNLLFSSLVGLTIAPILSAVVILLGGIEISENIDPPLEEWGASIAALFLAISLPVMLSPLTGFVAIQGTQMIQSTISAATSTGMAMATGGASAAAGMSSAGAGMGGSAMKGVSSLASSGMQMSNMPELNNAKSFDLGDTGVAKTGFSKMDMAKHVIAGAAASGIPAMTKYTTQQVGVKGARDMSNIGKPSTNPTNIGRNTFQESSEDMHLSSDNLSNNSPYG